MTQTPPQVTGTPELSDRAAGGFDDADPLELVPQVLGLVRLHGAIFFRSHVPLALVVHLTGVGADEWGRCPGSGQPGDVPHHRVRTLLDRAWPPTAAGTS